MSKGAVSDGTSKMFGRFLSTHPEYFQARFIDLSGKEQIDSNSLTDKSNRYYFKESVGLKNNNVFVSRMDLNVENGQVELPYRPTIRFLTPVSLGDEKMGIAGINLDARNWLESFDSQGVRLLNSNGQLFFKDGSGEYEVKTLTLGLFLFLIIIYYLDKRNKEIYVLNETIGASLNERNILLKELHHRLKNNLQVITRLLSLPSSFVKDEATKGLLRYSLRISSMAVVYEMLYQSDNLARIDYEVYLKRLVSSLIDSMKSKHSTVELHIDAKDIRLNVDTSITLGLMVNEIITNFLKYGFSEDGSGLISIDLEKLDYPSINQQTKTRKAIIE